MRVESDIVTGGKGEPAIATDGKGEATTASSMLQAT